MIRELRNLTPHKIVVHSASSTLELEPSGTIARINVANVKIGSVNGCDLYQQQAGAVTGLPEQAHGIMYVVSAMVRLALPYRTDLASPGELVRNAEGQPIGCNGLVINGGSL